MSSINKAQVLLYCGLKFRTPCTVGLQHFLSFKHVEVRICYRAAGVKY